MICFLLLAAALAAAVADPATDPLPATRVSAKQRSATTCSVAINTDGAGLAHELYCLSRWLEDAVKSKKATRKDFLAHRRRLINAASAAAQWAASLPTPMKIDASVKPPLMPVGDDDGTGYSLVISACVEWLEKDGKTSEVFDNWRERLYEKLDKIQAWAANLPVPPKMKAVKPHKPVDEEAPPKLKAVKPSKIRPLGDD